MRKLLLVRHSQSAVTAGLAPDRWPLTEEGRRRCGPFADRLAGWEPSAIVASEERKAFETGRLIGERLGMAVSTAPGLHEHLRPAFDQPDAPDVFRQKVARLFSRPDELHFGLETANEALERFESAVRKLAAAHAGNVAVVTHGTVIALLAAKYNPVDVMAFWQRLDMPDLIVLEADSFRFLGE